MSDRAISTEQRYPAGIRDLDIWIAWAFDGVGRKRPRAPWLTGNSYPVSWGKDADERPETTFEEAEKWASFRKFELDEVAPFPDDAEDTNLKLGILLPHSPPDPPIMQVDLDDVRNPETGEINEHAQAIMERLDAYTMVSVSGTGIHVYVRAQLPEGMGKFIEDFHPDDPSEGQLELYDHARFAAITGEHVEGTPIEVPERQEEIEAIIEEYSPEEDPLEPDPVDPSEISMPSPSDSSGGKSPYYTEPVTQVAKPAHAEETGEGWGGAHPGHGATSAGRNDQDSTNFAINKRENAWYCFAHSSGGGPLSLVAIMENDIDIGCRDCVGGALKKLTDEEFLELCLTARDEYGFSGDPPYRALVSVARKFHLSMADSTEGILGRDCYEIARRLYDRLD